MKRRQFIKSMSASLVLLQGSAMASQMKTLGMGNSNKKIVWVMLRGAMDSLHTIVPTFDQNLVALRPTLHKSIIKEVLPLDRGFALHPALKNIHGWYLNKELTPIIAVGSGYGKRSHFDGQDYLESGLNSIDENSGWLSRAISLKNKKGLAIARTLPVSLRGSSNASTWFPSQLKDADNNIYDELRKLYEDEPGLLQKLEEGLNVQSMAGVEKTKKRKGKFEDLAKSCANLLKGNQKIDCAMLDMGGWDTHNNQHGRLHRQFTELDNGLSVLKQELGDTWNDTVVIVATEFGRTAKENGTGGTDHGTASAMFIAGGNLKGGKVLGDWPGLSDEQLFEQRDLKPTSNAFYWIADVLSKNWHLSPEEISTVFPLHLQKYT